MLGTKNTTMTKPSSLPPSSKGQMLFSFPPFVLSPSSVLALTWATARVLHRWCVNLVRSLIAFIFVVSIIGLLGHSSPLWQPWFIYSTGCIAFQIELYRAVHLPPPPAFELSQFQNMGTSRESPGCVCVYMCCKRYVAISLHLLIRR